MRESRQPRRGPAAHALGIVCALAAAGALSGGLPWPSPAQAATADETARARAKLQEGARALDRGDHEQALARFHEAFDIVPSPKIFFNFGLAHEGLGHHAEALDAFERFLSDAQDASAATRAQAGRYVASLRPRVGSVQIACPIDGAEIKLDGRAVGMTPLGRRLHVEAGAHELVVQRAGLAPHRQDFTAVAGGEIDLVANLAPLDRAVSLAVVPPPAAPTPPPPPLVNASAPSSSLPPAAAEPRAGRSHLLVGLVATAVVVVAVSVTLAILLGGSTSFPRTDGTIAGN